MTKNSGRATPAQDYAEFLARKTPKPLATGCEPLPMPDRAFDFQAACADFAIRQGRAGIYLDTGLGKSAIQSIWANNAAQATNGRALILTPLAVAQQMRRECEAFGYEARVIREQSEAGSGINICNYDRLDKLDADEFGAVSLDEASVLKSIASKTRAALTRMFRAHRFKLCATATPAPNDHMELGQQADFLGVMSSNEMLSRFFINDTSTASQKWRLKGHAHEPFWDWLASWSRMASSPDDLGFDGSRFVLPPLEIVRHRTIGEVKPTGDGLFADMVSATSMHDVKRQTSKARAEMALEVIWASLNQGVLEWTNDRAGKIERTRSTLSDGPTTPTARHGIDNQSNVGAIERDSTRQESSTTTCDTNSELDGKTIATSYSGKTARAQSAERTSLGEMEDSTSTMTMKPAPSGGSYATDATSGLGISATSTKILKERPTTSSTMKLPTWVCWCDTNDEQTQIEKALGDACVSITGSQSIDVKEELHQAWLDGARPVLVTKPSIMGFGCNWQHCHNMMFVGRTFSYEAWYQAVRRCWRFGQTRSVIVHLVVAEGEDQIGRVIDRKSGDHERMKLEMTKAMRRAMGKSSARMVAYEPTHVDKWPEWLLR